LHAKAQKHVKRPVAKQAKPVPKPKPVRESAQPLLAAAGPVAATSSPGTLSPALLIAAFGLALALIAVGVSFMPASALPFTLGLRLERSRQTILLFGLAIGVACTLVGLLTAVAGR
jgi:F0F1-type ATP synthase membrane subunit c/vacuolar-type H+-ATPase subunit K